MTVGALTSMNAADTLADAFKNGKTTGTLEAWYWDRDMQAGNTHDDILNVGLKLSYTTDTFHGFFMGATLQTSNSPFASSVDKTFFKANEYGPGAILSEAYLGYKMDKTVAKIGRQYIATPLIASSPNRIIKQSFEGATLVNTNLPQTMLFAGYVNKYQNRTDLNGGMAEFSN
jgi:hypothetical protein